MVVLVTGSSRGLGASIIREFASKGWDVIINYNNSEEEAYKLQEEVWKKYEISAYVYKCDVSNEEEVKKLFDELSEDFDHLDCVVNNAGIAIDNILENKISEEFMKVIKNNLLSTYLVSKYCKKILNNGSIINIASDNIYHGSYIEGVDYDASKAGIVSLTHNFARDYAPSIRVNAVAPGWIDSDMNKDLSKEFKNNEMEKILLKRFAKPDEIADAVYFLANNTYVCDTILKINGGKNE